MSTLQQLLCEIDAKQELIKKQRPLEQTQIKNLDGTLINCQGKTLTKSSPFKPALGAVSAVH